jgi:hypothetical protein
VAAWQKLTGWESDNIRVRTDTVYRIGISGAARGVQVGVRWRAEPAGSRGATNLIWSPVSQERELASIAAVAWAQVLVVTKLPLTNAAQRVWLVPLRQAGGGRCASSVAAPVGRAVTRRRWHCCGQPLP